MAVSGKVRDGKRGFSEMAKDICGCKWNKTQLLCSFVPNCSSPLLFFFLFLFLILLVVLVLVLVQMLVLALVLVLLLLLLLVLLLLVAAVAAHLIFALLSALKLVK